MVSYGCFTITKFFSLFTSVKLAVSQPWDFPCVDHANVVVLIVTLWQTNIPMEHGAFEDVFPIGKCGFSLTYC